MFIRKITIIKADVSLLFRLKRPLLVSIIISFLIFSIAFGSYFFFRGSAENNVRELLIEQQKQRQIENTKSLSEQIKSDLENLRYKMRS